MKNNKKFLATIIATALVAITVIGFGLIAYAGPRVLKDYPKDLNSWTLDEWRDLADALASWRSSHNGKLPYEDGYQWNGYTNINYGNTTANNTSNGAAYYNVYTNINNNSDYVGVYNYYNYNYYNGIINEYNQNTEGHAALLARIIYLYAHGAQSQTVQADVAWAVLNALDGSSKGTVLENIVGNFHYDGNLPLTDDYGRDLMQIARDVIFRWKAGRAGIANNGRTLPIQYIYLSSDGANVQFYTTPNAAGAAWNYQIVSPYGN